MAATGRTSVGTRRPQSLSDRASCQRHHPGRAGTTAVGRSVPALWSSRRDVDGSRLSLVGPLSSVGIYAFVFVADASGYPLALESYSSSANARQGRAFPWITSAWADAKRNSGTRSAGLARRLSLGAQPCTATRGTQHENAGECVESQSAALRFPSTALGVSVGRKGSESEFRGTSEDQGAQMEDQQSPIWRMGAASRY